MGVGREKELGEVLWGAEIRVWQSRLEYVKFDIAKRGGARQRYRLR